MGKGLGKTLSEWNFEQFSLVVPGIFTVIDRMSKLFKELMGRTGLRGFGRDRFGSKNQGGCLRK